MNIKADDFSLRRWKAEKSAGPGSLDGGIMQKVTGLAGWS